MGKEEKLVSRRSFLKGSALTVAALGATAALGGCASPASTESVIPSKWDKETDVLVIGFGGAGCVTAITAHDAGANVLILEKAPIEGGGNTRMCGGLSVWPSEDTAAATDHLYALSWGSTPKDICQTWAEEAHKNKEWLDKMGVVYTLAENTAEFPNLPGAKSINNLNIQGGGNQFFKILNDQVVNQRKIEVMFNTPATQLVQNPETKEVIGAIAKNGDKEIAIKAKKAVVLCCGGFEYNETKKLNFLRAYPVHFYGWQYNTGDGIDMAQKVGAGIWHMNNWSGRCIPWFKEHTIGYVFAGPTGGKNYVYVNKYGARYGNETISSFGHNWWIKLTDFDIAEPGYTRIPTWMIFDETTRLGGPITLATATSGISSLPTELGGADPWSKDNSAEIAKGWILKGDTIEDLAKVISAQGEQLDPDTLKKTIDDYNSYCTSGKDLEFDRSAATLQPVVKPPFYAVKLYPGGPNTQGGPIRNAKAQVCDYANNPIPRLYSNGECGSVYGFLYPTGGGNMCELMAFGRIAGTNAAAEKSWA
jgi:succinate dehydrogenase/fumarate reductase flavoprotein subunit